MKYEVCDHCNLRCAGCLHFAPLAEEHILDLDEYEHDLEAIAVRRRRVARIVLCVASHLAQVKAIRIPAHAR